MGSDCHVQQWNENLLLNKQRFIRVHKIYNLNNDDSYQKPWWIYQALQDIKWYLWMKSGPHVTCMFHISIINQIMGHPHMILFTHLPPPPKKKLLNLDIATHIQF